ncbi:MAG TPA: hypothetical protein VIP11_24460 [Gemmatimonadaceae bacterium]
MESAKHGANIEHDGEHRSDKHASLDKHAGHSVAMVRRKFWVSLLLTLPTLVWGEMIPHALGFTPPAVPRARWIPVVFGVAVYFYGGWVFIQGARRELANRLPGMMTLISIAITVAFVFSIAVTFGFAGMTLWWKLSSLITIMLFGHWMEMRSVTRAQGALAELAKLLPNKAIRLDGDGRSRSRSLNCARATWCSFVRARVFRPCCPESDRWRASDVDEHDHRRDQRTTSAAY